MTRLLSYHTGMSDVVDRVAGVLRADPRVQLVYAFGSAVHGTAGPLSDVDVAVLADPLLTWDEERGLRARIAEVAPVVDLLILNHAPPALRFEVITGGRCVFARDARGQAEFEITSLSRFLDYQPVRRVQQAYLRARVEERRGPSDRSVA